MLGYAGVARIKLSKIGLGFSRFQFRGAGGDVHFSLKASFTTLLLIRKKGLVYPALLG